jgi:protein phosphatase
MSFKLSAAFLTDPGQVREQNEDNASAVVVDGETGLFIIADGMGGYLAGEVASSIAVEKISDALKTFLTPVSDQPTVKLRPITEQETMILNPNPMPIDLEATIQLDPRSQSMKNQAGITRKLPATAFTNNVEVQLKHAIDVANKAILRYSDEHPKARGMGCTLTMALVQNGQAHIANVGDSRTYLWRQGKLMTVTKDHSLVAKLVEAGQITQDEVYTHPQRNLIYQSLGAGRRQVEPDVFHEALQPGDKLLLCSDGLWEMVREPDIRAMLSTETDPQLICESLIHLANANGGEDNISAIVVQVK